MPTKNQYRREINQLTARAETLEQQLAIESANLYDERESNAAQAIRITDLQNDLAEHRDLLAACEAKLPPPPPPALTWRTVKTLSKRADWNSVLIEGYPGALISDIPSTPPRIGFWVPPNVKGERVELQTYFGEEGMTCAYEWTVMIPAYLNLASLRSAYSLISQGHGNERAGFTSGTKIVNKTDELAVSVKGGEELSLEGSHRYEYEQDFTFGKLIRGKVQTIRHEVHWHRDSGYYRARVDQGPWAGVYDVPTWPIGNKDGVPTENIMLRLGFYPQWGIVPSSGLEMFTGPLVLQEMVS